MKIIKELIKQLLPRKKHIIPVKSESVENKIQITTKSPYWCNRLNCDCGCHEVKC